MELGLVQTLEIVPTFSRGVFKNTEDYANSEDCLEFMNELELKPFNCLTDMLLCALFNDFYRLCMDYYKYYDKQGETVRGGHLKFRISKETAKDIDAKLLDALKILVKK